MDNLQSVHLSDNGIRENPQLMESVLVMFGLDVDSELKGDPENFKVNK